MIRLATERCWLRPATRDDVDAVLDYFRSQHAHLAPWSPRPPADFLTRGFWVLRLEENLREMVDGQSARLFVWDRDDSRRVLGVANLTKISRGPFQNASLGYSIRNECQGMGLMTEALRALLGWAFASATPGPGLQLHRVQANYMPHNRASGAVLRKLGFHPEGYARRYLHIAGNWEDHVLTAITVERWEEIQAMAASLTASR